MLDEVDKFPGASKKEANPIKLAKERTKTFPGRKIFQASTPTLRTGHIWKAKEGADIEKHYFVPCPHSEIRKASLFMERAIIFNNIQEQLDNYVDLERGVGKALK